MEFTAIKITFDPPDPWREIALALLCEFPFEGFTETKTGLIGYIQVHQFTTEIREKMYKLEGVCHICEEIVPDQNWNSHWESNYLPVEISPDLVIAAPFHTQKFIQPTVLRIQPQMSFGTGHHQTTRLMARTLMNLNVRGKKVADMGTGTGVLAILAEKCCAAAVLAIDIDHGAIQNAVQNGKLNGCTNISFETGDHAPLIGLKFDVILANINKNTLTFQMPFLASALQPQGVMLTSGFFTTDKDSLIEIARENNLIFEWADAEDEWCLIKFTSRPQT